MKKLNPKYRRLLITLLVTVAAVVALGAWLPSFNKWTVKDIPLLVRSLDGNYGYLDYDHAEDILKNLMKTEDGFRTVMELCADENEITSNGASAALSRLGIEIVVESTYPSELLDIAVEYTTHENANVRIKAYNLITNVLYRQIRDLNRFDNLDYGLVLVNAFYDEDSWVRNSVLWRISRDGHQIPEIEPALMQMLTEDDDVARVYAAAALAFIDPTNLDPLPILFDALESEDEMIRRIAVNNIEHYGSDAVEALPHLVRILASSIDGRSIWPASKSIIAIGPGDGTIIPMLIDLLDHENREVRNNVLGILEHFGSASEPALPALYVRLNSDVEPVANLRDDAQTAIDRIERAIALENTESESEPELSGGDPDASN